MSITTADIMKLRKATSAGMMDCKKALEEAGGDHEKAVEIIRKKGLAIASKRADMEAKEGAVLAGVSDDNLFGAVVGVSSETDFVAKTPQFIEFVEQILASVLKAKVSTVEDAKKLDMGNGKTIEEEIIAKMGVIGEKMELAYFSTLEAAYAVSYIHTGNKLACVVGFSNRVEDPQVGKDIAMQVAAMNPIAIDESSVSQEILDKELEIGKEKARQEGKPEAILDKIAQGRLKSFLKESTLLNQLFVKDNKQTIQQYLQQADSNLTVTGFQRESLK